MQCKNPLFAPRRTAGFLVGSGTACLTAGAAHSVQREGVPLDGKFRPPGDHCVQRRLVQLNVLHPAAPGAEHMVVIGQGAVKPVSLTGNAHPAHTPGLHKAVQVAVHRAQAQAGAVIPHGGIDLVGGGVIAAALHLPHHQFPLP